MVESESFDSICSEARLAYYEGFLSHLRDCFRHNWLSPEESDLVIDQIENRFVHGAVNLCETPAEEYLLARLLFESFGYIDGVSELWDVSIPFDIPNCEKVVAPKYPAGNDVLNIAIFIKPRMGNSESLKLALVDWHLSVDLSGRFQNQHDQSRGQLMAEGWRVIGFSQSADISDLDRSIQLVSETASNWLESQD